MTETKVNSILKKHLPTLSDSQADDVINLLWESEALSRLMKKHLTGMTSKSFEAEMIELVECALDANRRTKPDFIELNGAESRTA